MESKLGRIEDYNKVLPIVELYRCVQSEGSRFGRLQLQLEQQVVLTDAFLEKADGAILGTQVSTQKKEHLHLTTSLKYMTKTLILKK
jgi:hypothetical protein